MEMVQEVFPGRRTEGREKSGDDPVLHVQEHGSGEGVRTHPQEFVDVWFIDLFLLGGQGEADDPDQLETPSVEDLRRTPTQEQIQVTNPKEVRVSEEVRLDLNFVQP